MELALEQQNQAINSALHEWQVVLLDQVAKRGSGHTPSKSHPEYWNGPIKWISLADSSSLDQVFIDETEAKITEEGLANSSAVLHPAGTVVLSRDAGIGKSAIMRSQMAVSQHFMAWLCGPKLNNHFLYYWLQAAKPQFEQVANGTTIKTIGLQYFKDLRIPLPPLHEQQAIATALSDVDSLLGGLDQLIAKKRDLKQATMEQLLTGKTRLSGSSSRWEPQPLGSIATILKGRALSKSLISTSGVHLCILYGELFTTYGRVITEVFSCTNSGEGVPSVKGDVLMPGSTTTDGIDLATASALLRGDVALGGDIIIIRRRSNEYDSVFLANYLTHARRHEIAELTQGITIHHLYGKDLKTLMVELPPIQEQVAIAKMLTDMETEITALEKRREKIRIIKQGMMQQLLTGKVRLV